MSAPSGHWLLGHIPALRKNPLALLDDCHGPVAELRLGRKAWLLLEPADIAHVLEKSDSIYSKGRAFQFGRKLYGKSLLVSEGAEHQQQLKQIGSVFFKHSARNFLDPAPEIALNLASGWKPNQRINLWQAMLDLTLAISSQAIFGSDWLPSWLGGQGDALLDAFESAMDHVARQNFSLMPLPDWTPAPASRKYRQAIAALDKAFVESLNHRRDGKSTGGFLDRLMEIRDAQDQPFPTQQLRDQTLIFMLGGYESTATTLSWTLLLLARHDRVQARLIEEINNTIGERLPANEDVRNLPIAAQVVSESLRLYPPPWLIPRTAMAEDDLPSGLHLPAKAQLFLSPYRTQRDERFFAEPLRFDPERFAQSKPQDLPSGVYFPFGSGPRHCIGETIARSQIVMIVATLLRRWQFKLESDDLPRPEPLLTLRPPNPMWVRVAANR